MTPTDFGTGPDGRRIRRFRLSTDQLEVDISDYGATLVAVRTPDRDGRWEHVLLGHDDVSGYADPGNPFLGGTIGRVANRIGGASFGLDGRTHRLLANDGPNHLHGGGPGALHRRPWDVVSAGDTHLELSVVSPDGDEGYPGRLEVTATFVLADARLELDLHARTDAPTPVNLTSHGYFDLTGRPGEGDVTGHEITVDAAHYTPVRGGLIPTGEIAEVAGTPLDLRAPVRFDDRLPRLADDPAGGFDHNYVLDGRPGQRRRAARVVDPGSGRSLELVTDQPCVQVYSGNLLDGSVVGREGRAYGRHSGFCLEPQAFPDAVNHPAFPSVILTPDTIYRHSSAYVFGTV